MTKLFILRNGRRNGFYLTTENLHSISLIKGNARRAPKCQLQKSNKRKALVRAVSSKILSEMKS